MTKNHEYIFELLGYPDLFSSLDEGKRTRVWSDSLKAAIDDKFDQDANGNLPKWLNAIQNLPDINSTQVIFDRDAISALGDTSAEERKQLHQQLMQLHPWRKGPFNLFDIHLDTEWRSDLKWNRVASHVELRNRNVLDVGCGNSYYGWRMLGAGAKQVIGLEPFLHYVLQNAALRKYFGSAPNYVLPFGDQVIPKDLLAFDTVFSMGVLYHCSSPIDHLRFLSRALLPGGQLVLETLVIELTAQEITAQELLVPVDRYAKMRNVWFIPSVELLKRWIARCGFADIDLVDVTVTTVEEQRATEWMKFESLSDFLDPHDPSKTIEGYPSPTRAIITATKKR